MLNTIVDRIIDVQLMMKSLHHQSKKCSTEELNAKNKAKNAYKSGDVERARIYAETAVQRRKQSQHYQMLNARLSPILMQLKETFADSTKSQDSKELANLLQDVTTLEKQTDFEVSQNEINNLIQNLQNDQSFETSYRIPTHDRLAELEQRLANLRRTSP